MAGIQASTGLISGVPIQDTVDKLLAVSAQPRDRLQKQTTGLQNQQLAVNQLTALVIGVQLSTDQLGKQTLFTQNKVQSSSDAIAATASSDAKVGRYSFVPFRQAQQQQFTSSSLASSDQLVGAGEIKIHAGGFLDASMALDNLNGGTGVARGQIRITDRSGASTVIDLRTSQSARDVIDAINSQSNVRVTAKLSGDRFQLTDSSGGSGTLTVSEVNSGVTARDLGLANIAAAANTASGSDVVSISRSTALRSLRDGLGVRLASSSNDSLSITLRDGSTVNFKTSLSANSGSVGQLIDAINAAGGGKFQASINATGNGLQLQDLTSGAGTFTVTSPSGNLAKDLGWDQPAVGGTTLSGQRVQSGLGDVLLSSLGGGAGLSTLGGLTLRDRSGATATVNLNSAETIGDVIDSINAAGLGINARLNDTRTGITLIDTSGSTSTTLAATNADATNTATKLGLGTSTDPAKIAGASLERQWIHENTLLSQWNQGRGLTLNSIKFTNSAGQQSAVNLSQSSPKTVGDMLNAINAVAQGFEARINETGDGILLVDTAGGSGSLTVTDVGSGTTAKQLRIAGSSQSMTVGNATVKGINGSLDMTISTTSTTTVAELVTKLNESGSAVQASLLNLGTSGVRLAITSGASGVAGRLAVDSSSLSVAFSETAQAQDALLSVGGNGTTGGVLLSSSSNSFTGVAEGLDITINNASTSQVTVDITANNDAVTKQMSSMVDQFNKLRDKLGELTAFDPAKYTTGLLFGSTEALRVDLAFGQLFAGKVSGAGSIRSIAELGISFNDKGKLEFNRQRFQAVMDRDPAAVKEFFTNTERGFSTKAKSVADSLSGTKGGALLQRTQTLQAKIDINNKRIESINKRLDAERTRLLNQFYGMESAISKIQANLSSINKIAPLST